MRDYRAYVPGSDGHVRDRVEFFCENDELAKTRAKQLVDGHDIELWHLDQKVAVFRHSEK